jgi:predicted Zn-dependent protease
VWISFFLAAAQVLAPFPLYAQLPALGDGADMSSSAERRLGDRIAREIYRDPDYIDDPVLVDYVQGLWLQLMAAARTRGELSPELDERFAWEIVLGRDRSVNAFALPGGYMGVHLGLIAVVTSEAELASVLAHELSHITQRHISRLMGQQGSQGPWLIAAMILGALAASRNPQAGTAMMAGGQAAAIQGQLNFSRDMEREADRVGYGVMTQAGFEPQGFVSMFEKLQQANRFNDTGAFPYLRSHPLTTERIADMQARQQLLPRTQPTALTTVHAMLAARARMLSNTGVDAQRAAVSEAGEARMASQAPATQAGVFYAAALAASGLRDFAQAAALLGKLQVLVRDNAQAAYQVRLLASELALASGNARRAIDSLAIGPNSLNARPVLFLWAQAMTQTGQSALVAQQLQTWVATHPRDAQAWQLLSAAYSAQGQTLPAVRAEAEAYAAHLDYTSAQSRLKGAQDLVRKGGKVDHFEASIIDTRSRQIDSMLREQALER